MRAFFKNILLFFLLPLGLVANEHPYTDEQVADLITVITSTSPIPSIPSTEKLYETQKSLFLIPAL